MKNFNAKHWLAQAQKAKANKNEESAAPTGTAEPAGAAGPAARSLQTSRNPDADRGAVGLPTDETAKLERVLQALEATATDITATYATWRDLGFALSSGFGEVGRGYFHRLSRFHPEYDAKACDRQYDACLKSKGSGITLATFYHHVKEAGALRPLRQAQGDSEYPIPELTNPALRQAQGDTELTNSLINESPNSLINKLPTFPDTVFTGLPQLLQEVVEIAESPEERDILVLGALSCISACLPNIFGIYAGDKVYPNLYLYVTAPASAGKGRLKFCRNLVDPLHQELRHQVKQEMETYQLELQEYNEDKKNREKPLKPAEKMLFLPANSSNTGLFQLLRDNDSHGLLFETEGDTLANTFKTDYGNYSDGFRKGFHHEPISYYRKTDQEYVYLAEPKLSAVFTGTPQQVRALIPDAENGLFSRFLFYYMNTRPEWKDVFAEQFAGGLGAKFERLGMRFQQFNHQLATRQETEFMFTKAQERAFNKFFAYCQKKYQFLQTEDYVATVRRLGLIFFRSAMILTVLRLMERPVDGTRLVCSDADFRCCLEIIEVALEHSSFLYSGYPQKKQELRRNNRRDKFLKALPAEFDRQNCLQAGKELKIPEGSLSRYLTQLLELGLVEKLEYNSYRVVPGSGSNQLLL